MVQPASAQLPITYPLLWFGPTKPGGTRLAAHRDSMRQLLVNLRVSEQLWAALGELPGINGSDRLTTALYDARFGGHRPRRSSHVRSVLNTTGEAIGEQTATRDLTSLAELGYLVAHGERRARFYLANAQLTQSHLRIRNRVTEQPDHPPTPQARSSVKPLRPNDMVVTVAR